MPEPTKIYLREKGSQWVFAVTLVSETRMSWLTRAEWLGSCAQGPRKRAKRDYDVVTEQEYREWNWARENDWHIAKWIESKRLSPAILRQVAELIGYNKETE